MADKTVTVTTPSVEAAPVVAPVEAAPAVVVSAPAEAPAAEPAPAEGLLALAKEPEAAKPDEVAPVEAAPEVVAEPESLPTFDLKLPEGFKADEAKFGTFTKALGEFQVQSKAEAAAVQAFGQKLVDMHVEELKAAGEKYNRDAWDWFKNRNKEWLDEVKADPQLGGTNIDATANAMVRAITLYGGNAEQQKEVITALETSGLQNHKAIVRFISNVSRVAAKEGTPVQPTITVPKVGIAELMYGKTSGGTR